MAKRYYRKRYEDDARIPKVVELLWGSLEDGERPLLAAGLFTGPKGKFAKSPAKNIDERDRLESGEFALTRHTRNTSNRLTLRQWISIKADKAILRDGVVIADDPDLLEENV